MTSLRYHDLAQENHIKEDEEDGQMFCDGTGMTMNQGETATTNDKTSVLETMVGVCYGVPHRPLKVKYKIRKWHSGFGIAEKMSAAPHAQSSNYFIYYDEFKGHS